MTNDNALVTPSSPDEAWIDAEDTALQALCEITKARPGKTAFVGANPGVLDAWHLNADSSEHGSSLIAPAPGVVHVPYYVEGIFSSRAEMLRWGCRIVAGLPVVNRGNLQIFRVAARGFDEPFFENRQLVGEGGGTQIWRLRIHLELVFLLRTCPAS